MAQSRTDIPVTSWVGWVWYAAIMLMIIGSFDVGQGIVALVDDTFEAAVSPGLLVFDLTTWAWVHIIAGAVLVIVGIGLWNGHTWARVLGVIVAALNAITQLTVMLAYPFWALLMVALNIVVIFAIVVHGQEAKVA